MSGVVAIAPILLVLILGYGAGRLMPSAWRRRVGALLGPLVLALLFSIGLTFGAVLRSGSHARAVLGTAIWLAIWTTMASWALITLSIMIARRIRPAIPPLAPEPLLRPTPSSFTSFPQPFLAPTTSAAHLAATSGGSGWWGPAKECLIALVMVVLGTLGNGLCSRYGIPIPTGLTGALLLVLVSIVGMELAGLAIDARWWSRRVLAIPLLVIIGSLIGGTIAGALARMPLPIAWALSSGFGWFTLSGVMIGRHLGAQWGAIALLTDLFRELMSVVLLYLFGRRFARACIGASAATALDSTLPIIKQNCAPAHWPTALVSGFVLSLAAPLLMTVFLW